MTATRPYILLGASALERWHKAVQAALTAWSSDWCVATATPPTAELSLFEPEQDNDAASPWLRFGEGAQALHVQLPERGISAIGDALLSLASGRPHVLIERVAQQALAELATSLSHALAIPAPTGPGVDGNLPANMAEPGSGAIHLQITVHNCLLQAVTRVPATPVVKGPHRLVARKDCLGAQSVQLRAELSLGALRLSELHSLRPGDIIKTPTSLNAAFSLAIDGHGVLSDCRLGRLDQQRCVRLAT